MRIKAQFFAGQSASLPITLSAQLESVTRRGSGQLIICTGGP
jgi:hypothetical protein